MRTHPQRLVACVYFLSIRVFHGRGWGWNSCNFEISRPKDFFQWIYRLRFTFQNDQPTQRVRCTLLVGDIIKHNSKGTQRCDESGNILWLSERSESLATYALCGFSNFASIGILNGVLRGLAPSQGSTIIKYSFLALYGATIACFCTGCVVSMLYGESEEPFLWGDVDLRDCEYSGWNSCNITCNTVS